MARVLEQIMNDAIHQLAILVHRNPGVYALLLGSGVASSAGIPTAWDVVADLIRQIAVVQGESIIGEPYEWYKHRFGREPQYDDLLKDLGHTPLERKSLLLPYFEPTDEERAQGIKLPTKAHKAIASLIKGGYIRVVLTTNFDRLLQMALKDIGITPDVISTDVMLKGARPLQHSPITIVKLHGDYRDGDIRNTEEELATYSEEMKEWLDRVFDEYGLIVCGWSAKWDVALRDAIYRTLNRRYSTYWAAYGQLSQEALDLIQHRHAEVINIVSADTFFEDLDQSVQSLASANRGHPLPVSAAVERVKKLILDASAQIELEEFLRTERQRAFSAFTSEESFERLKKEQNADGYPSYDRFWAVTLDPYYEVSELVLHTMATLCWFGDEHQSRHVASAICSWAEGTEDDSRRFVLWQYAPSLFLVYAGGLAALKNEKWGSLASILLRPKVKTTKGDYSSVLRALCEQLILAYGKSFLPDEGGFLSDYLHIKLRCLFQTYIPSDSDYDNVFDLFEMLLSLVYLDIAQDERWMPPHIASFSDRSWPRIKEFWSSEGADSLLRAGFFDKKGSSLYSALEHYRSIGSAFRQGGSPLFVRGPIPDYGQAYKQAHTGSVAT